MRALTTRASRLLFACNLVADLIGRAFLRVRVVRNAPPQVLSAIGAVTGIVATLILSIDASRVFLVFCIYLVSNIAWMAFSAHQREPWVMTMNTVYLCVGINGLVRYWS